MKKRVLILGNSTATYALAKKMSETCEVFAAPGNDGIKEFAQCIDIRENSAKELLEYVLENNIDITIPVSVNSFTSEITEIFTKNNAKIFAPAANGCKITQDKAFCKKLLYRLRIPTPKFGIFDKSNMALDYIKNQNIPFVIKTNDNSSAVVLTSPKSVKNIVESVMAEKNQKIIIEDYVYGQPFAFYAITDGYKAVPIGSSLIYKHSLDGGGGQLTSGMGACSPNYKLSFDNEDIIMNNIIYPILSYLEQEGMPYLGILGVNGILSDEGEMKVLGLLNFMQDCDCAGILELVDTDIYSLFESCIIGSFSDEVDFIPQKNCQSVSVALNCNISTDRENVMQGLDMIDSDTLVSMSKDVYKNRYLEFEAKKGTPLVLTAFGGTVRSAVKKVYEEIENLNFEGIKYRKDICKISDNN